MSASNRFLWDAVEATLTAANQHAEAARQILRKTQNLTPKMAPVKTARHDLLDQIRELEGALAYMGEAHPERVAHMRRLEQLCALLLRWDQAPPMQQVAMSKNRRVR